MESNLGALKQPPAENSPLWGWERLAAIVESSEDAIVSKDLTGRITTWNRAAERIFGYTSEEVVGKPISVIIPPDRVQDMFRILDAVGRGEKIEHFETVRVRKDGVPINVSLTVSPILDSNGTIIGASKIARDITEQKRREIADTFLAEASSLLASSLEYKTTLNNVAQLAVPDLADWCAVDILEEDNSIDRLAIAHVDPSRVEWARRLQEDRPVSVEDPYGVGAVLRTGKSELHSMITASLIEERVKEEDRHLVEEALIRSAMVVPLVSRGRTIGALTFVSSIPGRYGQSDLDLAEELGRRSGLAVDNARLVTSLQNELTERRRTEIALDKRARELSLLYEAGRELSSTLDPTQVYLSLRRLIAEVMECENLVVSSYSPKDEMIRCEFAYVDGEVLDPSVLPPLPLNRSGTGIQSQIILSGEGTLIGNVRERVTAPGANYVDVDKHGNKRKISKPDDTGVSSLLLAPVRLKGEVIGVVQVSSHCDGAYDHDDLRMLEALVLQMAAATQNAHLYQQTREAESRYRTLVSASTAVTWSADPTGNWNAFQPNWQAFSGQDQEQQIGWGWLDAVQASDRESLKAAWAASLEAVEPLNTEARIWHAPSHQYAYCEIRSVPLQSEKGEVLEWVGTITNISERKRNERRSNFLLTLNDKFRTFETPDAILHGVVVALGQELGASRCTYGEMNPEGTELVITDDYVRDVSSIIGSFEVPKVGSHTIAPLKTGEVVVVNDTLEDPRLATLAAAKKEVFERIQVRSYIAVPVLRGPKSELQGVLSVQDSRPRLWSQEEVDLTVEAADRAWLAVQNLRARMEIEHANTLLETRVRERTAALEAANRELEGFSYTVSHDLRGPLRAITASSMMLIEDYSDALPPEAQHRLQRQVAAANKLARLIDDVLKLSRLTRLELTKAPLDLSAIATEVAEEIKARHPHLQAEFDIEPGLAAEGDGQLIRLLFQNLYENSFKFAKKGERPSIKVRRCNEDPGHCFCVCDSGIGFEQDYAEKIFAPFERLHREDQYPGTGIGLANVRRIVEKHGGRIWAKGEIDRGAMFCFTL